jgi:hypothetical protein
LISHPHQHLLGDTSGAHCTVSGMSENSNEAVTDCGGGGSRSVVGGAGAGCISGCRCCRGGGYPLGLLGLSKRGGSCACCLYVNVVSGPTPSSRRPPPSLAAPARPLVLASAARRPPNDPANITLLLPSLVIHDASMSPPAPPPERDTPPSKSSTPRRNDAAAECACS